MGRPAGSGSQTSPASTAQWQARSSKFSGPSYNKLPPAAGVSQTLLHQPHQSPLAPALSRERTAGLQSERSLKKRRIASPPHDIYGEHALASDRDKPVKPGERVTGSKLTITVPLPPECQNGAHRCTHRRRGWLKSKKKELERTRGVTVLSHSLKGSDALFDCKTVRPMEGPQHVCASSGARQLPVPPSEAKQSLPPALEHMRVDPETNEPSSSRVNASVRRWDGHPDTEVCSSGPLDKIFREAHPIHFLAHTRSCCSR